MITMMESPMVTVTQNRLNNLEREKFFMGILHIENVLRSLSPTFTTFSTRDSPCAWSLATVDVHKSDLDRIIIASVRDATFNLAYTFPK
jgi:hypothetical protein